VLSQLNQEGKHMNMTAQSKKKNTRQKPKPLTPDEIGMIFEKKRSERRAAIEALVAKAKEEGRPSERIVAAIVYDSEHAPWTTNRKQLSEIGIEVPPPEALSDEDISVALKMLIEGLALLGIYLSGTDHLGDRDLYTQLATSVILEQVRDVGPDADVSEFIDMSAVRPSGCVDVDGDGDDTDDAPLKDFPKVSDRDATLPRPDRGAMAAA
jgi:hypothetical protein